MDVGLFTLAVLAHLVAEMVHNILIIQFGENSEKATQSGAIVNYMKQKMQDFGDVEHNVVQQVKVLLQVCVTLFRLLVMVQENLISFFCSIYLTK